MNTSDDEGLPGNETAAFLPKAGWFKLRVLEFETEEVLTGMSATELGAYMRLMVRSWTATPPCTVPNDDVWLANVARVPIEAWPEIALRIRMRFDVVGDRLRDRALFAEFQDMQSQGKKRSRAGRRGADARWRRDGTRISEPAYQEQDLTMTENKRLEQDPNTIRDAGDSAWKGEMCAVWSN